MTTPRAGLRIVALVSVVGFLGLHAAVSQSGDEVDYSAPYLVVENGELVTRYPAKAHVTDATTPREATPRDTISSGTPSWIVPAGLIAAIAVACGLLVARSRR